MFKSVPGNHSLKVSLQGKFVTSDNWECTPIIQNGCVFVEMYGKKKWVDVNWLALVSHFEIDLPVEFINRIFNVRFVDTRPDIPKSVSGKVMLFRSPITINQKYRIVPCFTDYAVSCHGEVIKVKTKENVLIKTYGNGNYPTVEIYDPDKSRHRSVVVHKLVALAWVINHDFVERPIINHRDGNKNNTFYRNLEWVSYSENANHAFETGLRTDNQPCKLRDRVTGDIHEFSSLQKAFNFAGTSFIVRLKELTSISRPKLVNGRYELKLSGDNSPWHYEKWRSDAKIGKYTLHVTYPDGSKEDHPDIRTFKKQFKVWNVRNVYELKAKAETMYPGMTIDITSHIKIGPVQAYNVKTGETFEASSIQKLSKTIGLRCNLIRYALKTKSTRVTKGFVFRYKSDEPWQYEFTKHNSYPVCIQAENVVTGEIINFKSLREAERELAMDRSVIVKRLETGETSGDWTFKKQAITESGLVR